MRPKRKPWTEYPALALLHDWIEEVRLANSLDVSDQDVFNWLQRSNFISRRNETGIMRPHRDHEDLFVLAGYQMTGVKKSPTVIQITAYGMRELTLPLIKHFQSKVKQNVRTNHKREERRARPGTAKADDVKGLRLQDIVVSG